MEVRIRYKQKSKSETGSVSDGHTLAKNDQGDDQLDKDKLMMRTHRFTEQQLSELKNAFSQYDRGGTGSIAAHDFGNALRSMGQTPTESELKDILLEAALNDNGRMSLEEFLRLVGNRGLQTETEIHHDLEDALRFFDKGGRGLLRTDDLRTALKSYGEPLDDDDLTEMMKMADVRGDGRINCLEFVRKMTLK